MKKKLLVLLFSLATLGLASCGGGNDVASSGATAVSAAAPTSTTTTTEAKLNGQIDERTGVLLQMVGVVKARVMGMRTMDHL